LTKRSNHGGRQEEEKGRKSGVHEITEARGVKKKRSQKGLHLEKIKTRGVKELPSKRRVPNVPKKNAKQDPQALEIKPTIHVLGKKEKRGAWVPRLV